MNDEDESKQAFYEGWYSRLRCGSCDEMFEVEDDVKNGERVTCDACGAELVVELVG